MNAARYKHSYLHSIANAWLVANVPTHQWLIDFDLQIWQGENYFVLRPDIAGKNKADGTIDICIEISDSTLSQDLNGKRALYASAGMQTYMVIDCQNNRLLLWTLQGSQLRAEHDLGKFAGLAQAIATAN